MSALCDGSDFVIVIISISVVSAFGIPENLKLLGNLHMVLTRFPGKSQITGKSIHGSN